MRKKGFTLLELVVVIAVIAIFLGIAIPSLSSVLENSKYLQDKQDADAMTKLLDEYGIHFASETDMDMERVLNAILAEGYSVKTASDDSIFIYCFAENTIYAVKDYGTPDGYDPFYRTYANVSFTFEGETKEGYVLDKNLIFSPAPEITGPDPFGVSALYFVDSSHLYLERRREIVEGVMQEVDDRRELTVNLEGIGFENTDKKVMWSSSDPEVVKFENNESDIKSADGDRKATTTNVIEVVGHGTAIITVTVEGYDVSAQIMVSTDIKPTVVEAKTISDGDKKYFEEEGDESSVKRWEIHTENGDSEIKYINVPVGETIDLTNFYESVYKVSGVNLTPSDSGVIYSLESQKSLEGDQSIAEIIDDTKLTILNKGSVTLKITASYESSKQTLGGTEGDKIENPSTTLLLKAYNPLKEINIAVDNDEYLQAENNQPAAIIRVDTFEVGTENGETNNKIVSGTFNTNVGNANVISYKWTVNGNEDAILSCDNEKSMNLSLSGYGVYTVKVTATDIGGKEMTASYTVIVMKQYLWKNFEGTEIDKDIIILKENKSYPKIKIDAGVAIELDNIVVEGTAEYPQYNNANNDNIHITLNTGDYTTVEKEEKMTINFKYNTFAFAMAYSIYVKTGFQTDKGELK